MKKYVLPLDQFFHWEKTAPDRIYLKQPIDGKWVPFTFKQSADEVRRIAAYLKAQNLPPGSKVAILSKNCAHWLLADYAIWAAGHVSVPLYPNLTGETIGKILEHSDSKFLFVGKLDNWEAIKSGVPAGLPCMAFDYGSGKNYPNWKDIVKNTLPLTKVAPRELDELATLIYTSGTTGQPKGVMHKFRSFAMAATETRDSLALGHTEIFFSYLPLAHVAERLLTQSLALYAGSTVCFAESLDKFAENLREAAPTCFLGVPRIWTKFQSGILAKLPQKKLSLLLSIPIVSSIIKKKLQKALGLQSARYCVSGAAAIAPSLIEWFATIGIQIREGYGLTENFAYSHLTYGNIKIGTVGNPWPFVETKIGENQEILVKSDCTMMGYYKEPEMTKEAMSGDFLRTGDQGVFGEDRFLKITGRVKDLFKTTKGKYVVPGPIEMLLSACPHIEQVCVVGTGLAQPIAITVLNEGARKLPKEEVDTSLKQLLLDVNKTLDQHERIAKVVVTPEFWTVENNLLTPSLKVKRNVVEKKFENQYDKWAGTSGEILRN